MIIIKNKTKKLKLRSWIKNLLCILIITYILVNVINTKTYKNIINKYLNPSIQNKKEDVSVATIEDTTSPKLEDNSPLIYIYNTHPKEEYKGTYLNDYNINPNVTYVSSILKEKLDNLGINTIVEEKDVVEKLNSNGWKYGYSYKVSRSFLEDAYKDNPSLIMFIDIHRDSGKHSQTTLTIDNKSYAKILFVVGLENDTYEANLENTYKLNEIIDTKLSGLSRGILEKQGKGVNGVYNQDFSSNTFLIEVGGEYNELEELTNTLEVLSISIKEYLGDYSEL